MKLTVNGETRDLDIEPDTPLLWALREELELQGTEYGCGIGMCGACTGMVDGVATRSCVTPVDGLESAEITTIEAIETDPVGARVVEAWVKHEVAQCGYCQSGQVMATVAMLRENPRATAEDAAYAISNLCRCGTYNAIDAALADLTSKA